MVADVAKNETIAKFDPVWDGTMHDVGPTSVTCLFPEVIAGSTSLLVEPSPAIGFLKT